MVKSVMAERLTTLLVAVSPGPCRHLAHCMFPQMCNESINREVLKLIFYEKAFCGHHLGYTFLSSPISSAADGKLRHIIERESKHLEVRNRTHKIRQIYGRHPKDMCLVPPGNLGELAGIQVFIRNLPGQPRKDQPVLCFLGKQEMG